MPRSSSYGQIKESQTSYNRNLIRILAGWKTIFFSKY